MKKKEITVLLTENDFNDDFTCDCGNTVTNSGFYPCNENGEEIEPTKESNWTNLYVCGACGRIFELAWIKE